MFLLRLKQGTSIGLGIHRQGVKIALRKTDRDIGGLEVDLDPAELSLVSKALEVTRRTLAGGTTAKPPRALEFVPNTGTGRVSAFMPTSTDGQQAVLWVSNGTGGDGAVYLDHLDLEKLGDWAHSVAQDMRTRAAAEELRAMGG